MESLQLSQYGIGDKNPVFMVAEISGNHNQDIKRALKLIDAAAEAGANGIKLQTYTPDTITLNSQSEPFMVQWKEKKQSLYDLYQAAHTPWEWHQELFSYAHKRNLLCFSSPFDPSAVSFLEELKTPLYKVASFEVVDIPLLKAIGQTKKPVLISRGMALQNELQTAIKVLKDEGTKDLMILECVSAYPANPKDMHLKNIPDLMKIFNVPVGLSDHTLTNECAIAAVALGAKLIEKHFTLKRSDGGPDSEFSLEPHEFASLVNSIRIVEQTLSEPNYEIKAGEKALIKYRKSLFACAEIGKGELFSEKNIRSIRPGHGLPPKYYDQLLGKRATQDITFATPLKWEHIEGGEPTL